MQKSSAIQNILVTLSSVIIAIFVCSYLYISSLELQQILLITKFIDTYNSSNSRYLDDVVKEAKGNMRVIEQKLGLEFGFLNDNDVMIVLIKKEDFITPRFPTGNEIGVNNLWIPGGLTSGGIPELVMDFSLSPKFSEIKIH